MNKHRGIIVPMATPFDACGAVDEAAVRRIVENFAVNGLHCFVLGTTGEAASISLAQRQKLVEIAVEAAAGRVLVYAGIADNCLAHSVACGKEFLRGGAAAVVALLPGYFPLNALEMRCYFERVAGEIDGPTVLYNMPLTTHMSLPLDVVETLSAVPNIIGFKDSQNDVARLRELAARCGGRDDFSLFVGVASHAANALQWGFDGAVPSSGNIAPAWWRDLWQAAETERWDEAAARQHLLDSVAQAVADGRSLAQSLAALKMAMHDLHLCEAHVLPPLLPLDESEREALRAALAPFGLKKQIVL